MAGGYLDRAGSRLRPLPFILRRCQQAISVLPLYLPLQIDLSEPISIKSGSPPWESFGRAFGPPGDPQVTPGEPQVSPRDPTGSLSKPQETSRILRKPQESPRNPRKLSGSIQKASGNFQEASGNQNLYTNHLSGVKLPIARLWRPVC